MADYKTIRGTATFEYEEKRSRFIATASFADTEEKALAVLNAVRAANRTARHNVYAYRLREGNREYFFSQLDRHFPGLSDRYRRCYGSAYEVVSPRGRALMSLMEEFCREQGICMDLQENFHFLREFPNKLEERQMKLW